MTDPMGVGEFADHLLNHAPKADTTIVCDAGANGDDVVATMVASGLWRLSEVQYVAGKRIQHLVPTGGEGS